MDVRDDAPAGDRGLDERVELLVPADGELQVARRDALHLQVLGRVARELQHLGAQVRPSIGNFAKYVRIFKKFLLIPIKINIKLNILV